MNISGTSAVALALLLLTALLLIVAVTSVRPREIPPPVPRGDVKGEARSRPAPRRAERHGVGTPSPEAFVVDYYEALDARRFAAAWKALSPAVRDAFGGFEGWRAGYATTVSSRPSDISVSADGVEHVLTAVDRSPCGNVRRRFAVTWGLRRAGSTWVVERLSAVKRSGPEPAEACA